MAQEALVLSGLLMGLAGGPHCVAMCGAACAGIGRAGQGRGARVLTMFHIGRIAGYTALGAVAATSMQAAGWLGTVTAALRPVWTLLHAGALAVGLMLLFNARQPAVVERAGRAIWQRVRVSASGGGHSALTLGALWALMPCGLLYAALFTAALTSSAASGAMLMALFALGSGVSLVVGPMLWLRTVGPSGWSTRIAGFALAASSAWVLWGAIALQRAPWCVVP
jgi:sulfite exporter TauE/SafE